MGFSCRLCNGEHLHAELGGALGQGSQNGREGREGQGAGGSGLAYCIKMQDLTPATLDPTNATNVQPR